MTPATRVTAGVVLAAALGSPAGCAGTRAGGRLTPSRATECAPAIPLARAAVHHHGQLVLLRKLKAAERVTLPAACLVVYRDDYARGGVLGAAGGGRYAEIVVAVRHPRVLRVTVTDTAPRGLHR